MAATYKCPKCQGFGRIAAYAGIADGICFSCEGAGVKVGVAAPESSKWAVYGTNEKGEREVVYFQRAKNAAEAIKKALKAYARASEAYRARYSMEAATAEVAV